MSQQRQLQLWRKYLILFLGAIVLIIILSASTLITIKAGKGILFKNSAAGWKNRDTGRAWGCIAL